MAARHPVAIDQARVGRYPALTFSGGGYFWDDLLEYRVWVCPPEGGDDYYRAFATYDAALSYWGGEPGAQAPIVLIRQREWIVEKSPGWFVRRKGSRITEWRVEWLPGRKRVPGRIEAFLNLKVH